MKKSTKLISVILALIMALSCVTIMTISVSAKTYSGKSGSIKWTVNTSTKKLTIAPKESGSTGKLSDYASTTPPWNKYKSDILHIVINSGVTAIGQKPFISLSKAKDITIGKSVTSCNTYAFNGCSALTKFSVNSANKYYTTISGVLFSKDKTKLVFYPQNKSGSSYLIPSTVTQVKTCAFYENKNLTSIRQESSNVKKIENKVFKKASKLKVVYIKNNCTSIGTEVFNGSNALTEVTLPPSITSIGDSGTTLFSPKGLVKDLKIYLAPNSPIKNKLSGKGYTLINKDYKFTCNFDAGKNLREPITNKKEVIYGKEYGNLPVPQKEGNKFKGWFLGNKQIEYNTLVSTAQNHTLTAKYEGKEYNVTLDPNGGHCDFKKITVIFDERYGILPTPTRDGYIFLGWYTENNNGQRITVNSIYNDETIKTLYAHWIKKMVAVKNLKIKYKNKSKIKLTWSKQPNIAGYKVYKKVNKGKFKLAKTTKTNKYISPKLSSKKKYTYKVRAYRKENGKIKYSPYSKTVKRIKTFLPKVKIKAKAKGRLFKVSWKSNGAYKYEIYQKIKNKWKKALTTSSRSFSFYYNYNKKYSFRIRGYKKVLGHKFYSKFSKLTKSFLVKIVTK